MAPEQAPQGVVHHAIILSPWLMETNEERDRRRRRRIASLMRRSYDLAWVPEEMAARIRHVEVRPEQGAVVLALWGGTRIVDREDRIDVVGEVDDVAVEELAEAVRRRGWDAVEIHGDPIFRRRMAFRLRLLDPPVAIANDPLTDADRDGIDEVRRTRSAGPMMDAMATSVPPSTPGF